MNFIKRHRIKIIVILVVVIALTAAFFKSGTPVRQNTELKGSSQGKMTAEQKLDAAAAIAKQHQQSTNKTQTEQPQTEQSQTKQPQTEQSQTEQLQTKQPQTEQPQTKQSQAELSQQAPAPTQAAPSAEDTNELKCFISVNCATALKNKTLLSKENAALLPENGVILKKQEVKFFEGESVFNILMREMKKNKIHFEYVSTPMYNSAYIEGISNLYEYDCGELSGWMYSVNGSFPDMGCSKCKVSRGDIIEVVYTCNLGIDVGGYNASSQLSKSQSE